MKELYGERLATHTGPESCEVVRKNSFEALTGVRAGRVLSRERNFLRGADAVRRSGRPHPAHRYREMRRDYAAARRAQHGLGKPETFNFLGFTHICAKKRSNGRFTVLRQTMRKRLQAKLAEVKTELRRRLHEPIPVVGQWLGAVVRGHVAYYGVPMNSPALHLFRLRIGWLWYRALCRRSHKGRPRWERMRRLLTRWLPPARVCHPYPLRRFGVIT